MTDPDIVHEIGLDDFLDQLCVEISRDVSDLDIVCVFVREDHLVQ